MPEKGDIKMFTSLKPLFGLMILITAALVCSVAGAEAEWTLSPSNPTLRPKGHFVEISCGVENRVSEDFQGTANGDGLTLVTAFDRAEAEAMRKGKAAQTNWLAHRKCPQKCPRKYELAPAPSVLPAEQSFIDLSLSKFSSRFYASTSWTATAAVLCIGVLE
jgi:hypothetical protein